jgi:hypothetical protein
MWLGVQVNLFESADGRKEQAMADYIFGVLGKAASHTLAALKDPWPEAFSLL